MTRILIVDDVQDSLDMMAVLLGGHYEVDTAVNAAEALGKYYAAIGEGEPYALLVLDAALPAAPGGQKMSGFNVAEAIRASDTETPIAIHSAYIFNDDDSLRRADKLKLALWRKPDDSRRLPELVAEIIASPRP